MLKLCLFKHKKKYVLKLVQKCLKKQVPQFFMNHLNRDIVGRTTRQSNLLHLPKVRTESAKKSFYYNGALFLTVSLIGFIDVYVYIY